MLAEYISSLLLVTLILKHVWYQRTCSNQYVVDGVWYLRLVEVLSISAANCVRLLTCYNVWTSDFIHLAFPDPHTSAIKEIRFETLSFSFEKITFYVAMNVFLGAGDRSGLFLPLHWKRSWLLFFCILYAINLMVLLLLNFQLSHRLRSNSQARLSSDRAGRSSSKSSHVRDHRVPVWSRNDNF